MYHRSVGRLYPVKQTFPLLKLLLYVAKVAKLCIMCLYSLAGPMLAPGQSHALPAAGPSVAQVASVTPFF